MNDKLEELLVETYGVLRGVLFKKDVFTVDSANLAIRYALLDSSNPQVIFSVEYEEDRVLALGWSPSNKTVTIFSPTSKLLQKTVIVAVWDIDVAYGVVSLMKDEGAKGCENAILSSLQVRWGRA